VAVTGDEDETQGVMEQTWKDRIACIKGQVVVVETYRQNAKDMPPERSA